MYAQKPINDGQGNAYLPDFHAPDEKKMHKPSVSFFSIICERKLLLEFLFDEEEEDCKAPLKAKTVVMGHVKTVAM